MDEVEDVSASCAFGLTDDRHVAGDIALGELEESDNAADGFTGSDGSFEEVEAGIAFAHSLEGFRGKFTPSGHWYSLR